MSYGSETGFNVGLIETVEGNLFFFGKNGKWQPIETIAKGKPALYNGGIPFVHHYKFIKQYGYCGSKFWGEPYPVMPNVKK